MLDEDHILVKGYESLSMNFGVGVAGTFKASGYDEGAKKEIMEAASLAYYQIMQEKRTIQVDMYKACPDLQTACKFFNLLEKDTQTKFIV